MVEHGRTSSNNGKGVTAGHFRSYTGSTRFPLLIPTYRQLNSASQGYGSICRNCFLSNHILCVDTLFFWLQTVKCTLPCDIFIMFRLMRKYIVLLPVKRLWHVAFLRLTGVTFRKKIMVALDACRQWVGNVSICVKTFWWEAALLDFRSVLIWSQLGPHMGPGLWWTLPELYEQCYGYCQLKGFFFLLTLAAVVSLWSTNHCSSDTLHLSMHFLIHQIICEQDQSPLSLLQSNCQKVKSLSM